MARIGEHVLTNAPVFLQVISIILHLVGIYLLSTTKLRRRNQDLLIINLSVCELAMSALDLSQNLLQRDTSHDVLVQYIIVTQCTLFVVPSLLIMIILTLDRLAEVYYNIKYDMLSQRMKIPMLVTTCWITGIGTAIPMLILNWRHHCSASNVIYKFIFPAIEGIFLIIAVGTYSYIYTKYRRTLMRPLVGSITRSSPESPERPTKTRAEGYASRQTAKKNGSVNKLLNANKLITITGSITSRGVLRKALIQRKRFIRRKNFFVPSLIILTFILFVIVPDQLNLFIFHIYDRGNESTRNGLLMMYATGFIADAVIYIFLQKHIRHALLNELLYRWQRTGNPITPASLSSSSQRHPLSE